jgi:signal transduction histidine kinase/uncharacterized OsmC-like protein
MKNVKSPIMKDKMFIAKQLLNKVGLRSAKSEVHKRQMELNKLYVANPEKALIVDSAVVIGQNLSDPFRNEVLINSEFKVPMKVGVHKAVGGDHDFPNPGDMLCASLAACVESTLRMIAGRLEIELFATRIEVTASIDVRGTLLIDKSVPVGFQSMHIAMEIGARGLSDKMVHTLVNATKRSCVVYQTLKQGIPITKEFNDSTSSGKFGISLPGPIEYCQDLTFEPNHDMITFGFANLDLTAPENNRYKFMLEGLNVEWIETGSRNEATFTDLSPGNYCLKVLGAGSSNVWNEEPTILNFRVLSPWYGTWWFRVLMSVAILGLLYLAYQYRLNQMLRFERMRNRIAQDLHDEIGSTLSSISLFSTVLQKSAKELSPKSISLLDKINSSTSEMMESMNDIVWTIKAENDSFEHVLNRMRSFASNCAETKGIRLLFEVRNSAEKLELGMDIRRNIYLIFKESLNNAVKYSECTELSVKISLQAETLYISVVDNGKGFDTEKELSNRTSLGGNGLKGVKFRANELGASLDIKSAFNQGTSIELQFPMKNSKLSVRP